MHRLFLCLLLFLTGSSWVASAATIEVRAIDTDRQTLFEGASVRFEISLQTGTVEVFEDVTDEFGLARAEFAYPSAVGESLPEAPQGRVFPNPADQMISLSIATLEKSLSDFRLALYDVRGRQVCSGTPEGGELALERPLPSGTYLYRLQRDSRTVDSGKFSVVGALSRIRFQREPAVEAEKSSAGVANIIVTAEGFRDTSRVVIFYGDYNLFAFGLEFLPAARTLDLNVWTLTGEWPLASATVLVRTSQGEAFAGTTDASGEVALDYVFRSQLDSLKIYLDGYPGYSNGTSALIDTSLAVVCGGRIDAANCFAWPETLTVAAMDPRLERPVRLQALQDVHFDDEVIRDGVSWIHQRNESFETEIVTTCVDSEYEGNGYGDPVPEELLNWFRGVVAHIDDELEQPNGTRLNTMIVVERDSMSMRLDRVHYMTCNPWSGPGNMRGFYDWYDYLHWAWAEVPLNTSYGTVMEGQVPFLL